MNNEQGKNKLTSNTMTAVHDAAVGLPDSELLIENSPIMLVRWTFPAGKVKFSYISQNIKQLGYSAEELMHDSFHWLDIIHPKQLEGAVANVVNAVNNGQDHYKSTYQIKNKAGEYRWIEDHSSIVRDAKGQVRYFQNLVIDITDRQKVELELEQKNAYLETLHETALGLMRGLKVTDVLSALVAKLSNFSATEHSYLYLVDKYKDKLNLVAGTGIFESQLGSVIAKNEGVSGSAWQQAKPVYIEDYQNFSRSLKTAAYKEVQSVAAVPLKLGEEVIAVMGFATESLVHFNAETLDLLNNFAHLAALAISNAQLYEKVNNELDERKALEFSLETERNALAKQMAFRSELADLVQASLSVELDDSFYQHILEKAVRVVPGSEAGSLLVKNKEGAYSFHAAVGYDLENLKTISLQPEEIYRDLTDKSPLRVYEIDNQELDEEKRADFEKATAALPLKVALSVPITINNDPVALFNLDNFTSRDAFSDDTLELAQIFANQVAALWQRFELEQSLRFEREHLLEESAFRAELNMLMQNVLSETNETKLYQSILEKAVEVIPGAQAGSLVLKVAEHYEFVAAVGFDLDILSSTPFDYEDFGKPKVWTKPILNNYFDDAWTQNWNTLSAEKQAIFSDTGPARNIQSSLSIPILHMAKVVLMFNLDNFSSKGAFTETSISMAQTFGTQIEALWQRFELETTLKDNESRYRDLFVEADRTSKELQLLDELQNAIANKLELDDLFDTVTKSIADIFVFAQVTISVIESEQLVKAASYGYSSDIEPLPDCLALDDVLVAEVIKHKEMKLINYEHEASEDDTSNVNRQSSILVLPLFERKDIMGLLFVESDTRIIDSSDQILMMKVVEQMRIAIENAKLHAHVKKDLVRTEALYQISQAIQAKDKFDELMESIAESIRAALGARWAIIYKIDFKRALIEHVSTTKNDAHILTPLSFEKLNTGLTGWAIEHKQTAFMPKGKKDSRENSSVIEQIEEYDFGSIIVAPLLFRGEALGTLATVNHRSDPDFSEDDINLMTAVANQASVALAQFDLRQRIEHQAFHDALTGLPNRRLFENRLELALAQAERYGTIFATMFIDLDGFKHINDTLGHEVGDELLLAVTKRLKERTRDSDTLARMGGDEFALIITNLRYKDDAIRVGQSYLALFQDIFEVPSHSLSVGASIGISLYPSDGRDLSSLLRHADSAMYQAKNAGKNSVCSFTQELADKAKERLDLENDLRKALENNELELYYQPQICLETGTQVGVEALLRWIHPRRGFISPVQFIPIAEETKLILPIGEWVLKEACRQTVAWQKEHGVSMQVAVNISALQFDRFDFLDTVTNALEETGLDPHCLELEVTESVVMQDVNTVIERLNELRNLGISIAIDDFGTGYSSLQYLQQLPLDKLKIDRSFINTIDPQTGSALVETIIMLAKRFGLKILAEGIEEKEQLEFLVALGCNEAQGYYFSKPVPHSQVISSRTAIAKKHGKQWLALDESSKSLILEKLTYYIGPVAKVIMQDRLEQNQDNLELVINDLAEQIPDPHKEAFRHSLKDDLELSFP